MTKQDEVQKCVEEIINNRRKIIDDWCKAYLAQLYEEGKEIKPGCFTLIEEMPSMNEGVYSKRYWFKKNSDQD